MPNAGLWDTKTVATSKGRWQAGKISLDVGVGLFEGIPYTSPWRFSIAVSAGHRALLRIELHGGCRA